MVVTEYFDGDQATGDLAPSTQVQQPSIPVFYAKGYMPTPRNLADQFSPALTQVCQPTCHVPSAVPHEETKAP